MDSRDRQRQTAYIGGSRGGQGGQIGARQGVERIGRKVGSPGERYAAVSADVTAPEWATATAPRPYGPALRDMERRVEAILAARAGEAIWLLEHEPVLTAGTSAEPDELRDPGDLPVIRVGRGGRYTWHGPGQRIVYIMLDLNRRRQDVRLLVRALEVWIAAALGELGVDAAPREGRVGLWVDRSADKGPGWEDKIAALGIRLRRWVTYHGISINVAPDLAEFGRILPCGIDDPRYGVTSLADLGTGASMADLDAALKATFSRTVDRLLPRAPR